MQIRLGESLLNYSMIKVIILSGVSSKKDFVGLILKVVDYCNYSCPLCGYAQSCKTSKSSMDLTVFQRAIEQAGEYNIANGVWHLSVVFHGGEPLLWGETNFRKAIELEKQFLSTHEGFCFYNNIQTNGSLINGSLLEFFRENQFNVGVSLDGPSDINYHNHNEEHLVLSNIRRLMDSNCNIRLLSVITDHHYGQANQYYDFLVENHIRNVGLCFCVDEGNRTIVDSTILLEFLIQLYQRCRRDNFRIHIREFENIINCCKGRIDDPSISHCCTFSRRSVCGCYYSVLPNGDVLFCDTLGFDDEVIGNIETSSFISIKNSNQVRERMSIIQHSINSTCRECVIGQICGMGCGKHIYPNGENYFCEVFRKLYLYIQADFPMNNGGESK